MRTIDELIEDLKEVIQQDKSLNDDTRTMLDEAQAYLQAYRKTTNEIEHLIEKCIDEIHNLT
jgi:flagellar biosynthesis chaperone FliJ